MDQPQLVMNRRQRRTLEAIQRSPEAQRKALQKSGMINISRLTEAAFIRLCSALEGYGNVLSEPHKEALMRLLGCLTLMAEGKRKGRWAFDLDTGCGKTQATVAWMATVHALGLQGLGTHSVGFCPPYSVLVAQSKIEALCSIKRELMENHGVPEEKIGLVHSYEYDPQHAQACREGHGPDGYASMPSTTDHVSKQFLLVSHQRVQGKKGSLDQGNLLATLFRYKTPKGEERPRSLCIWDESCFISDHVSVSYTDLRASLAAVSVYTENFNPATSYIRAAVEYIQSCLPALEAELERQKKGWAPWAVNLKKLEEEQLVKYRLALQERYNGHGEILATFLSLSQAHSGVKVVSISQGGGAFITWHRSVPPGLDPIAVLDASFGIRELEKLDRHLRADPVFEGRIKSYENVEGHFMRHSSGREAIEKTLRQAMKEQNKISQEVTDVVKPIPQEEAILIWTFKAKGRLDMGSQLREDFKAAGIDTEATIPVTFRRLAEDGSFNKRTTQRPRIVILTWGQETSLSEYSYCSNVIFAGVLHRSEWDLAGGILGQKGCSSEGRPLSKEESLAEIQKIKRSEIVHCIYQALSRGSCRVMTNGKANPMKFWLFHHDKKIKAALLEAMPNLATWKKWVQKYLDVRATKIEEAAEAIVTYLNSLSLTVNKIAIREVKKAAGLREFLSDTFQMARDEALQEVPWVVEGSSFIRLFPQEETTS